MKKRIFRSLCAFALLFALLVTSNGLSGVASAAKKKAKAPKLSAKKVTVQTGKSKKVTLKNKPAKAKVKWTVKNKKIATVKKGKITGKKAGNTKVTCAVTYKKGGKKVTKKLSVKVKVTKAAPGTKTPDGSTSTSTKPAAPAAGTPGSNATATVAPSTAPTAEPTAEPTVEPTKDPNSNLTEEHMSANGIPTKDNGLMRKELSNMDLMQDMGLGWNLGNQMEQSNYSGKYKTVEAAETSAGNSATQLTFDGLKDYGVKTVRVPVAWSNFMSDDGNYTISEDMFNRVEEIINYALNNEMYVIINIHWDGGWWGRFGAEEYDAEETPIRDEAWKKYKAIWTQIAERYKEYSDRLIFEGANEELSGRLNDNYQEPNTAQQNQTGKLGEKMENGKINADEIYMMVNQINQEFVNIVRKSGGNNAYRHLLIPGTGNESCVIDGNAGEKYEQDGTVDDRFKMPDDPAEEETGVKKMSISVHYYDPTTYGISQSTSTSWGYRNKWGVDYVDANGVEYKGQDDYDFMHGLLDKMKKFTDEGYGVILGECGVVKPDKDNIIDYMTELFTQAKERGMVPVWWDEGHYFNRAKGYFNYDDVGQTYAKLSGATPTITEDMDLLYTGIPAAPKSENQNPKVVAAWEGEFMRHTDGDNAVIQAGKRPDDFDTENNGIGKTTSLTDAEGNVTSGADAFENYSKVFGSWNLNGWTNSTTGANGEPVDKMIAEIDPEYWNIHFKMDWSKIEKPCVKVYPMDNEISQNADLQVGYLDVWTEADLDVTAMGEKAIEEDKSIDKDSLTQEEYDALVKELGEKQVKKNTRRGAVPGKCKGNIINMQNYNPGASDEMKWNGFYLDLDKRYLQKYPFLWITTNTYSGASWVKIEICDAAYKADGTKFE